MKVFTAPHPILHQKSTPVLRLDKKVLKVIDELKKTLLKTTHPTGLGLSAPQIGHSLRIFVINMNAVQPLDASRHLPSASQQPPALSVFINPEIIWRSKEIVAKVPRKNAPMEGCLSVPGVYGFVPRFKSIKIKYSSPSLEPRTSNAAVRGLLSTVFQHELDHLNGILFIDRILKNKGKLYRQKPAKNGKIYFEEIPITDF